MTSLLDAAAGTRPAGSPVELLIALTLLSLIPILAVSVTSFTRVIVVFGLLRASIGAPSLPPNSVLSSLAVMLTCVVMRPTLVRVQNEALVPYMSHHLAASQAIERGAVPLRDFMLKQARPADIISFAHIAGMQPRRVAEVPFSIVTPAFLVGELRAAFAMGFALALPFAVIDIVVAAVLMSLGMFMVAPAALSMPLKLLLFVTANGWTLVAGAVIASFR